MPAAFSAILYSVHLDPSPKPSSHPPITSQTRVSPSALLSRWAPHKVMHEQAAGDLVHSTPQSSLSQAAAVACSRSLFLSINLAA